MSRILLHPIVFYFLAAAIYTGLSLHFWHTRRSASARGQARPGMLPWERILLLVALSIHGITLSLEVFAPSGMRFGFSLALSMMLWLAIVLYWIESLFTRIEGLQMIGLPLAAVCVLLPVLFPGRPMHFDTDSPAFRLHFLIAMLAYSLFTLAALHALLMAAAEKHLHSGRLSPLLASLPPLMTMETLLFRIIWVGFVLLTLTLISGVFFAEHSLGKVDIHNTVFAVISWLIFAALLLGRHLRGWRGRVALRWTLAGFVALLLVLAYYVGSRVVIEFLGRSV